MWNKTTSDLPLLQEPIDWLKEADYGPWSRTYSVHVSYREVIDLSYLLKKPKDND